MPLKKNEERKWTRVLKVWTEACPQYFGGWEVQTVGHLQKKLDAYGEVCFDQKYVWQMS